MIKPNIFIGLSTYMLKVIEPLPKIWYSPNQNGNKNGFPNVFFYVDSWNQAKIMVFNRLNWKCIFNFGATHDCIITEHWYFIVFGTKSIFLSLQQGMKQWSIFISDKICLLLPWFKVSFDTSNDELDRYKKSS